MITKYDYFYDAQVKRYLMQVVRALSGFQYMPGTRGDIPAVPKIVPCTPAKRDRQVAAIQRNMSENTLLTVPMISVFIKEFEPDRERMQSLNHIDSVQVTERAIDPITGQYTNQRGNSATIERMMPRPYMMTVQVDIWTSNLEQKLQLLEQIDTVIFPGFDIQNSDNPLDWSALTTAQFESQVFSSVSIPIGSDNEIDVATITLKIPMWLSPPARITKQTLIHQVITNINDAEKDANGVIIPTSELARVIVTPGNHHLKVERGQLTLLGGSAGETNTTWADLFAEYKMIFRPGETQIRIRSSTGDDTSGDIIGGVYPTNDPKILDWQPDIDTLPKNTLKAINGVIDPLHSVPGEAKMPAAVNGQRYLITSDIAGYMNQFGSPATVWNNLQARNGSIIEYRNNEWVVSFDSVDHDAVEYVTNSNTGRQLKWDADLQAWVMAIDGVYAPGYFVIGGF